MVDISENLDFQNLVDKAILGLVDYGWHQENLPKYDSEALKLIIQNENNKVYALMQYFVKGLVRFRTRLPDEKCKPRRIEIEDIYRNDRICLEPKKQFSPFYLKNEENILRVYDHASFRDGLQSRKPGKSVIYCGHSASLKDSTEDEKFQKIAGPSHKLLVMNMCHASLPKILKLTADVRECGIYGLMCAEMNMQGGKKILQDIFEGVGEEETTILSGSPSNKDTISSAVILKGITDSTQTYIYEVRGKIIGTSKARRQGSFSGTYSVVSGSNDGEFVGQFHSVAAGGSTGNFKKVMQLSKMLAIKYNSTAPDTAHIIYCLDYTRNDDALEEKSDVLFHGFAAENNFSIPSANFHTVLGTIRQVGFCILTNAEIVGSFVTKTVGALTDHMVEQIGIAHIKPTSSSQDNDSNFSVPEITATDTFIKFCKTLTPFTDDHLDVALSEFFKVDALAYDILISMKKKRWWGVNGIMYVELIRHWFMKGTGLEQIESGLRGLWQLYKIEDSHEVRFWKSDTESCSDGIMKLGFPIVLQKEDVSIGISSSKSSRALKAAVKTANMSEKERIDRRKKRAAQHKSLSDDRKKAINERRKVTNENALRLLSEAQRETTRKKDALRYAKYRAKCEKDQINQKKLSEPSTSTHASKVSLKCDALPKFQLDEEIALINYVQIHPVLFDSNFSVNNPLAVRRELYQNFADEHFDGAYSSDMIRRKWNILKNHYHCLAQRQATNTGKSIDIKWPHFKRLSFLEPHFQFSAKLATRRKPPKMNQQQQWDLIEFVEMHAIILSQPQSTQVTQLFAKFAEESFEGKYTVGDLKAKWAQIKAAYKLILKSSKNSVSQWHHFDKLTFLGEYLREKRCENEVQSEEIDLEEELTLPLKEISVEDILDNQRKEIENKHEKSRLISKALKERGLNQSEINQEDF